MRRNIRFFTQYKFMALFIGVILSIATLSYSRVAWGEFKIYGPKRSINVRGLDGKTITREMKKNKSVFAVDTGSSTKMKINGRIYEMYRVRSGILECKDQACYVSKNHIEEFTGDIADQAQALFEEAKESIIKERAENRAQSLKNLVDTRVLKKDFKEHPIVIPKTEAALVRKKRNGKAQPLWIKAQKKSLKVGPQTKMVRLDKHLHTIDGDQFYKVAFFDPTAQQSVCPKGYGTCHVNSSNVSKKGCTKEHPCYIKVDETRKLDIAELIYTLQGMNHVVNQVGLDNATQKALLKCKNYKEKIALLLKVRQQDPEAVMSAIQNLCWEQALAAPDDLIEQCGTSAITAYIQNPDTLRCPGNVKFACRNSLWKCKNFEERLKAFKKIAASTVDNGKQLVQSRIGKLTTDLKIDDLVIQQQIQAKEEIDILKKRMKNSSHPLSRDSLLKKLTKKEDRLKNLNPLSNKDLKIMKDHLKMFRQLKSSQSSFTEKQSVNALLCLSLVETHHLEPSTVTGECRNSSAFGLGQMTFLTFADYYCRRDFRSQLPELKNASFNPEITFKENIQKKCSEDEKKAARKIFDRLAVSPELQLEVMYHTFSEKGIRTSNYRHLAKRYHGTSNTYAKKANNCYACLNKLGDTASKKEQTKCYQKALRLRPKSSRTPEKNLNAQNKTCNDEGQKDCRKKNSPQSIHPERY